MIIYGQKYFLNLLKLLAMDQLLKLIQDNLIIILPTFLVIFIAVLFIIMKRAVKKSKEKAKIKRERVIKKGSGRSRSGKR
jgi:hypothetical protein